MKTSIKEGNKNYTLVTDNKNNKFYYYGNKLHRELGPAIEYFNGSKVWFFEGKKIEAKNQNDFNNKIKMVKTAANNTYYDVVIEGVVPATFRYKVLASSPEEAYNKVKLANPVHVKHHFNKKNLNKITIYDAGTTLIRFVKNLIGRL